MKTTLTTCLLTAALGALTTGAAFAQSWETVDKFQLEDPLRPGVFLPACATDIGTGADGKTLFSVGSAHFDSQGSCAATIRRSDNSGATWTTVDTYFEPTWTGANYRAFAAGGNGTLLASGQLYDLPTRSKAWFVRESADGGVSWATVDAFYQGTTGQPSCGDVKMSPLTGDVFAVGTANTSSSSPFCWAVRKRAAGSQNFVTVDMVGVPTYSSDARAVAFHPTAGVFVVGKMGNSTRSVWTVRRSGDRGATWTTVDSFQDSKGTYSEARGIAVSDSGAIYVCGRAEQTVKFSTVNNWVVRRSLNGGATWTTVDRFGGQASLSSSAIGITVAPSGSVYITGVTQSPSHLLVRKGITASTGTMSWATINDYQLVAGQPADAQAITSDAYGNLFTAGKAQLDSSGLYLYLTRKVAGPQ